jgi:lysozyme
VGHTGPDVRKGQTITREQSQALLSADLARFEGAMNKLGGKMTQSQFDALVSFAFNLGIGALAKSTLLKKHLAGDYAGAAKEFARWNKAGGKVLAGLVKRRAAEAALYQA